MEPYISTNLCFVRLFCDAARATYSLKNKASRVFEVYEEVFRLCWGDRSVAEYYSQFRDMIDGLN